MTREEIKKAMSDTKREIVIKNLHKLLSLVEGYPEYEDCISYAIAELEQEPILDKIRAEIERLQKMCDKNDLNLMAQYSAFGMVLDILDKYKAETEEI